MVRHASTLTQGTDNPATAVIDEPRGTALGMILAVGRLGSIVGPFITATGVAHP
jgi:hypothetical protein